MKTKKKSDNYFRATVIVKNSSNLETLHRGLLAREEDDTGCTANVNSELLCPSYSTESCERQKDSVAWLSGKIDNHWQESKVECGPGRSVYYEKVKNNGQTLYPLHERSILAMPLTFEEEFKMADTKVRIEEFQTGRFHYINNMCLSRSKQWLGVYLWCKKMGKKVPFNLEASRTIR